MCTAVSFMHIECTTYTLYVRPCVRPDSVVIFKNHLLSSLCGISLYARAMRMPDAGTMAPADPPASVIRFKLISYISPPSHRLPVSDPAP